MRPEQAQQMEKRIAAVQDLEDRQMAAMREGRLADLRFAGVLCTCRPWYSRGEDKPPQVGCTIHGGVWIAADGSEML